MSDRKIEIVISATDDYSAQLRKFDSALAKAGGSVNSSAQKMESSWKNSLMGIQTAWLQLAGIVASATWLIDAGRDALAAEKNFNRLDIQLRNMGLSYNASVAETISASARYAAVQGEDVARTLQELIFITNDYQGSIRNLNLVYDLAYQKGIDASEAASLIGKAITGNVDMLGRYMFEFKDLEEKLGKHATATDKAAYAIAVFREKVAGARDQMTEHEKRVEELANAYKDLKQSVGEFALFMATDFLRSLEGPSKLVDVIISAYRTLSPYDELVRKTAKDYMDLARATDIVGNAHQKTAAQIAAETKAMSDKLDLLKSAGAFAEGMAKIQAEEDKFWADRSKRSSTRYGKKRGRPRQLPSTKKGRWNSTADIQLSPSFPIFNLNPLTVPRLLTKTLLEITS